MLQGLQSVTGVDPNAAMEPYAEQAALKAGLSRDQLQLRRGLAEELPLPDACADLVVCTLVRLPSFACTDLAQGLLAAMASQHLITEDCSPVPAMQTLGLGWCCMRSRMALARLEQQAMTWVALCMNPPIVLADFCCRPQKLRPRHNNFDCCWMTW